MTETLFPFLAEAVTPWHAVEALARRLTSEGFTEIREADAWDLKPGSAVFFRRGGGALAAFIVGTATDDGWRIGVAHTDSPGWRLKVAQQKPEPSGAVKIGTEVYGAPIWATWFDRPLAVAGRVFLRSAGTPKEILVRTEPLGLFPNLAIHYNREVNKGQVYDLSEHLNLIMALAPDSDVQTALARRYGFDAADWLGADLFAVEPAQPTALGPGLFVSPRIDNLTGCHAVIEGLIASKAKPSPRTRLAFCFDQEEVGSATWTGADSPWMNELIARVHDRTGGSTEGLFRTKAQSFIASVDSAQGVHPNWMGQHDEAYAPRLGQGPVIKASARFSYATMGATEAVIRTLATRAGIDLQTYVMKSSLVPGHSVGPMTTSWTGIPGVDIGIPIWGMHSSNETADRRDQASMIRLLTELYRD